METDSEDSLKTAILSSLNGLRNLIDASTNQLFAELPDDESWDDYPADYLRTLALDTEQEIWNTSKKLEVEVHFSRLDGTWKAGPAPSQSQE